MHAILRPRPDGKLIRLGSDYGGWWVPERSVGEGRTAYCAGAGEDISFDLELLARGIKVTVFDPTPRAIDYVQRTAPQDPNFRFEPVGWWDSEETLRFYAPRNEAHVSHSAVNLQRTDRFFEAQVSTVRELAKKLDDTDIEIIKMDIEGAEYAVLSSLMDQGPLPSTLCVEFDQPESIFKTIAAVRDLRRHGYSLRHIEGWNYTFTRD